MPSDPYVFGDRLASGSASGSSSGSASASGSYDGSSSGSASASGSAGRRLGGGEEYPECVGVPLGLLYALAPYVCMYMLWLIETTYKSRFAARSKVHYAFDLTCTLTLIIASMSTDTVASYRGVPGAEAQILLLILLIVDLMLWLTRISELAFFSRHEAARRQSAAELVVGLQVLLLWSIGWIVIIRARDFDDPVQNAIACDGCAALMWLGALRWMTSTMERPLRSLVLPGPHLIVERWMVPSNMGFQFQ